MKARPILMSAPMVRALLDGRKTQTRRALKSQPFDILPMDGKHAGREWVLLEQREPEPKGKVIRCRFGIPGDLLWCRETHAVVGNVDPGWVIYRASGYDAECKRHGFDHPPSESEIAWKPSIHMYRWASRLTLRLTDVGVERLQDISKADAIAEGLSVRGNRDGGGAPLRLYHVDDEHHCVDPRMTYSRLWESINGPESWDANPWCWTLTFDVIQANVDEVIKREAA